MQRILLICLYAFGWLLIAVSGLLIVLGTTYGITETRAFYDRIDAYYALDDEREALSIRLDSLNYIADSLMLTDIVRADVVKQEIEAIEASSEYQELLCQPQPPIGFSMAWLVTLMCYGISLPLLIIGLVIVVQIHRKKSRKHKQNDFA